MKWDSSYVVSRQLIIKIAPDGDFHVGTSMSRELHAISQDVMPVLQAFHRPRTPKEVAALLAADYEISPEELMATLNDLVRMEALTPADDAAPTAQTDERFGSALTHYFMLNDAERVLSYKMAIEQAAKDKVVVEIGCGTGILSLIAAQAGAKHVYAIEEAAIADVAQEMFAVNGMADRITLVRGNSLNVRLPERADLLIHEIIGTDPIDENILPVIDDARQKLLRAGGQLLPHRLDIFAIGYESDTNMRVAPDIFELSTLDYQQRYNLNFEPLAKALKKAVPPQAVRPTLNAGERMFPLGNFRTAEHLLCSLDLTQPIWPQLPNGATKFPLHVTRNGFLSGAFVYFRAHLHGAITVGNRPFMPLNSWTFSWHGFEPRAVRAGDVVGAQFAISQDLQNMSCQLSLVA